MRCGIFDIQIFIFDLLNHHLIVVIVPGTDPLLDLTAIKRDLSLKLEPLLILLFIVILVAPRFLSSGGDRRVRVLFVGLLVESKGGRLVDQVVLGVARNF